MELRGEAFVALGLGLGDAGHRGLEKLGGGEFRPVGEDDEVVIEGLQMVRDGTPVKTSPFTIDDTPVKDLLASVPGASPTVPPLPEAAKPGVQN